MMPDLLLELFSEEIPARMQGQAADDLERLVCERLKEAGLAFEGARTFSGPRRLTLSVTGLADASQDVREEKKGPRIDAPQQAIDGFLRGAGLTSIDEAEVQSDPKKGDFYVAVSVRPGRPAGEIVADIVPDVVRRFPWPRSMRWGAGTLRWVRPLHSILCILDGETVPFEIEGIKSGNTTRGHRFMAPDEIAVNGLDDYVAKLRDAYVIVDAAARREIIATRARDLCEAEGVTLVADDALVAENAGLTEWPVVLMGRFDEEFLAVPQEVLVTSMKSHQKCFSVSVADNGRLAARFVMVANLEAADGGASIVAGNERVIAARLSDAKFFWDTDRKTPLADLVPKLKDITFHEKLGTQFERVERLQALARELAPVVGADPDQAERAAMLCKADLVTEMVGEFPELQGVMGRYYALGREKEEDRELLEVARALAEHYAPVGPNDAVPTAPTAIAVALADKLDTLVGFWAIDEKPTGSKDPYALRRAALGVIRIVLENTLRVALWKLLRDHSLKVRRKRIDDENDKILGDLLSLPVHLRDMEQFDALLDETLFMDAASDEWRDAFYDAVSDADDLLAFFHDRLKVYLRDRGARHDLIDAVISPEADDLLLIVARVEALGNFLDTDDGANLLSGVKRAANILRIEEKKDKTAFDGEVDPNLLTDDAEKALASAITDARASSADAIEREDFEAAMAALAKLRAPVDAFFDDVTVNAGDADLRANRLRLLNRIRAATSQVADFSRISG